MSHAFFSHAYLDDSGLRTRRRGLRSPYVPVGHVAVALPSGGQPELLGTRRVWRRPGTRYEVIDMRRTQHEIGWQESPTADGLSARYSVVLAYRVADPVSWLTAVSEPERELHLAAQVAVRDAFAQVTLEDALRREIDLRPAGEAVSAVATSLGAELEDLVLRDLQAPEAISAARLEATAAGYRAAAQLERARADVAAARARAGAAKMMQDHPVLAKIAMIQALPEGAVVHFGVQDPEEPRISR